MKILVLNSGSSSVKYELCNIDKEGYSTLAKGQIEAIGAQSSMLYHWQKNYQQKNNSVGENNLAPDKNDVIENKVFDSDSFFNNIKKPIDATDHTEAISEILKILILPENRIIKNVFEISAVGHRIVHGGEYFTKPVIIDQSVIENLEKCYDIAPLHNPHNVKGILAIKKLLPRVKQVAVFDTAFHQTIPEFAYLYALPYRFYQQFGIRKYGFHGISNQYIAERLSEITKIPTEKLKTINCHLGNGASITAVKYGKSIETSMGFTPLEGLMMGSRCGDIDASIPLYLVSKESMKIGDIQTILNRQSGLLGISQISSDMRAIIKKSEEADKQATLAIEMFCYRVKKYISSYIGVLNGCDYIIFSAAIGERSPIIRRKILSGLEALGIIIDEEKNSKCVDCELDISNEKSKIKIYVIPTNETIIIAKETKKLLDLAT
ncbi:MAG: acetate kinase [Elusimicrobiota bacterium]